MPVTAAKIRSQITQAGALGDPVRQRRAHDLVGLRRRPGEDRVPARGRRRRADHDRRCCRRRTRLPKAPPPDPAYFPLKTGLKGTYSWTNTKHFKKPEVEKFTIDQAANGTAIAKFTSVSGPMKVAGAYQFTTRLDGVTSVVERDEGRVAREAAAARAERAAADKRRHFFTPFDLMTYGFNPVLPAYPTPGTTWSSDPRSRDFAVYGVTGTSKILGVQTVKVPAGTFRRSSSRAR